MIRMLITIPESEKQWLTKTAAEENISTAELVRRAITQYHTNQSTSKTKNIRKLLKKTEGKWPHGDGLDFQSKLREEWE